MEAEAKVEEMEQKLVSPGSAEGGNEPSNGATEPVPSKENNVVDTEHKESGSNNSANDDETHVSSERDSGQQDTGLKTAVTINGSVEAVKEESDFSDLPPEVEGISVPPHWHAKPSVHIKGLGGVVTKEDILSELSKYGSVSSLVFENERKEAAIAWFDSSAEQEDGLIARVVEGLNNHEINGKTLIVEAFQSDSLLFIGNLTPEIDDASLRKMFEPHGTMERAFVVRNAEGQSKCYGFVEFHLKYQASSAKVALGNLNMDGRVLRVEWSDCQKVADMFSTVLFVDRVPKNIPNVEMALKNLFGRYGKVKDICLVLGINNQFRGFAFIEFRHSTFADKAHLALDGHDMGGSKIRVSFANPSKSASSYKTRMGSQQASSPFGFGGRSSGFRSQTGMPMHGPRFQGPGRPGMTGIGSGQYGRGVPGAHGQGFGRPPVPSGGAMLGPSVGPAGRSAHGPLGLGTASQGPVHLTGPAPRASTVIPQSQRTPNGLPSTGGSTYQQLPQAAQQFSSFQGTASHSFQQPVQPHFPHHSQGPVIQERPSAYQTINQELQQNTPGQYQAYQQDPFYQQQASSQASASVQQQYTVAQQYSQQKPQQQPQQVYMPQYNQVQTQQISQPYQATTQQQPLRSQYYQQQPSQPGYVDYYAEQQSQNQMAHVPQTSGMAPVAVIATAPIRAPQGQELSQQQDYSGFYAQGTGEQSTVGSQSVTLTAQNTAGAASSQQSIEAQWAAYYAAQAAYQQTPIAAVDVGQKRNAEQLDPSSQQTVYGFQQPSQTVADSYTHQLSSVSFNQQQPTIASGYQQSSSVVGFQQPTTPLPLFQPQVSSVDSSSVQQVASSVSSMYQPAVGMSPYQQPVVPQAPAAATMYDYSKRPRF